MILDEAISLLESGGLGVFGVDLFASSAADIPPGFGPYLTAVETNGPLEQTHNAAAEGQIAYEHPNLQLMIRCKDYQLAKIMAMTALGIMMSVRNREVLGVYWRSVQHLNGPNDLGKDANNRSSISLNFMIVKRPSTLAIVIPEWRDSGW